LQVLDHSFPPVFGPTRVAASIVNGIAPRSIGKSIQAHLTRAARKRFTTQRCVLIMMLFAALSRPPPSPLSRAIFRLIPPPISVKPAAAAGRARRNDRESHETGFWHRRAANPRGRLRRAGDAIMTDTAAAFCAVLGKGGRS
jgi:hypothetical protein